MFQTIICCHYRAGCFWSEFPSESFFRDNTYAMLHTFPAMFELISAKLYIRVNSLAQ
jgi:hypothetical protein